MSREVLVNSLTGHDGISSLTLTGGEPSLAVPVIESIIELVQWRNVRFDWFYIVTNGKTRNGWRKFLSALDRLQELASEPSECVLTLSQDQFHRELHDVRACRRKFELEWGDYHSYFKPEERTNDIVDPINDGRAKLTGVGSKESELQEPWTLRDDFAEGTIYVAANGNVVSNCNMSYARIDAEAKGNVLKSPLSDIILSYSVTEQEAVA
jgi:organic radical activating enzyme